MLLLVLGNVLFINSILITLYLLAIALSNL